MDTNKTKHIFLSSALSGLLIFGLLILLSKTTRVARAVPVNLFIKPTGMGDCSQANPCDLQTALGIEGDGDTLFLSQGNYTNTSGSVINIDRNINMYGGWDGATTGPIVLDPETYPVVIDGEAERRGVYIETGKTVTLDGLEVSNCDIEGNGGGLYVYGNDSLTLRNMIFANNVITYTDYAYGGGAYIQGGTVTIENAKFRGNSAWASSHSRGGGLALDGVLNAVITDSLIEKNDAWYASGVYFNGADGSLRPFTLTDSIFIDNGRGLSSGNAFGGYAGALEIRNTQASLEGNSFSGSSAANDYGAVSVFSSELLFARNLIYDNQSGRTAGLYLRDVSPFTVTNNIITDNRTYSQFPAVYAYAGDGQFLHNTVARNDGAYGFMIEHSANVTLTNTILVSHTVGISVTSGSTATLEATLWGSGVWANNTDWGGDGTIETGTVNIWGDPMFSNPNNGNYHIGPDSAAIDAGVNAGVSVDINGRSRPQAGGYDIGADEFIPLEYIYLPLVVK